MTFRRFAKVDKYGLRNFPKCPKTVAETLAEILSIANQKGGVGKTTTAINLSRVLSRGGQRTLLVDMDPQCNATSGVGVKPASAHPLASPEPASAAIQNIATGHFDLLAGSRSFRDADNLARAGGNATKQVLEHLNDVATRYDYVVIDLPPSLGQLTRTALNASTEVLIPIQCEYFAMEGLTQMIEVIRDVMQGSNSQLDFAGILLTMYDHQLEITHEVDQQVREFFGEIVFDTVIPRDVSLCEAPSHGLSVLDYAPRSRGTRAYMELGMEILSHDE